ncbi:MAG: peptidase U32 family protein, partial [Planctomycetota bacterium]
YTKHIAMDAVIVADVGALRLVKKINPDVNIHISTQMSTANSESALYWKEMGAERVVLARECTLENAKDIAEKADIETEMFVHGAMCVAVSGRCLLSAYMVGKNASQGVCKHSCRWEWEVTEGKRPGETFPVLETEDKTIIFGSTDLCLIEHIPELFAAQISSLKIEGRMKGEYYVAMVTRTYRQAIDKYLEDPEKFTFNPEWLAELESVSHHPYGTGFAFGYPEDAPDKIQTDLTQKGSYDVLGIIEEVTEDNMLQIMVKNQIRPGDTVEWIQPDSSGSIEISEVYAENLEEKDVVHSGTRAFIRLKDSQIMPQFTIFRNRVIN